MLPSAEQLIVEWQQWPVRFQLYSSDAELAARATAVLRHWNLSFVPGSEPLTTVRMTAERLLHGYSLSASPTAKAELYDDCSITLRAVEMNAALALLDHHEQVLTVHAGLLSRMSRGVIIVGPSHSGKSTLSCALWHSGWQLLADDVAVLDCARREATPLLRRVSLRDPSRELLGEDFWDQMTNAESCDRTAEGYVFHPDELTAISRARSTPVSAVLFLARNGAPELAPAEAQLIDPVQALLALAPYTNSLQRTDLGTTMRRLGPLLNGVRAYDLARGPLDEMIATVERVTSD
ncbi:MAG: hypothetical protein ACR2IE_17170 [Candidatus Sumerlaeaceae bacterium]